MEALPADIHNLPAYYVPKQLFVCTSIVLIFFLVWTIVMFGLWVWRSFKHIHNYEYIVDHNIRREFEHAKKTYKERLQREREEQNQIFHSQTSESNATRYTPQLQVQQMVYNRSESRALQFVCLSVIVAININSFTCNIMEVVSYFVAVALFLIFNVFRVGQGKSQILRLLFCIPLIVAYIPFFVWSKTLNTV